MENKKRLIDANALMKYINKEHSYAGLPMASHILTMELLTYAPTVDAVEVVHGWWRTWQELFPNKFALLRFAKKKGFCSNCGAFREKDNYCPNCGAKMDKEN